MNISVFKNNISRLISDIHLAIRGDEQDYTSIGINRAILLLSVPMVLEMLMESLFAIVDVFYVGKLGVDAIATVGLTESIIMIVYAISVGLSMGITAMVSRRVGEKKYRKASDAAVQSMILALLLSGTTGIVGFIYAKDLLSIMGASEELIRQGYGYTQVMLGGNITVMLLFVLNAVFRGAGNAAIAMRVLITANGLNILLDPLFIFGIGPWEGMGVTGAAVATNIGRGIGIGYQLLVLFRGKGSIKIVRENLRMIGPVMVRLVKVSLGGMGQYLIGTASWIVLVRIISHFGSEAVAGYTVAFRIIVFTILPSWGIANAAATLVGQNLGAHQPERAEKSVWKCAFYNMLLLVVISIFFFTWAHPMVRIFTPDPEVVRNGVIALQIISLGYIFFAYGMVVSQAFNGAGDTRTPTIVNFFSYWILEAPLAYVLAVYSFLGIHGVYISVLAAELVLAGIVIYVFRLGRWKKTVI